MKQLYLFCCLIIIISCSKTDELGSPPAILQFDFQGIKTTTTIDPSTQIISVEVPYQTDLSALVPKINIETGIVIVPASGIAQNFSQAVYYTLSKGSNRAIYTIKVRLADQPKPEIARLKSDTTEAGFRFDVLGKNFGKFALDIQTFLVDDANQETPLKHQLIDSTQLKLSTSIDQKPAFYRVKVKVKNQENSSTAMIWIAYPAPQLSSLAKINLRNSDTLWLSGNYLLTEKYTFQANISNASDNYLLNLAKTKSQELGFILPKNVRVGRYAVSIFNQTERKFSREKDFDLAVYDAQKPFVTGILNPQVSYKKNDKITFKTTNFESVSARFYQANLQANSLSYTQNGIYDSDKKTLTIDLPDAIKSGVFSIDFSLTEPAKNNIYSFKTDLKLTVKD